MVIVGQSVVATTKVLCMQMDRKSNIFPFLLFSCICQLCGLLGTMNE